MIVSGVLHLQGKHVPDSSRESISMEAAPLVVAGVQLLLATVDQTLHVVSHFTVDAVGGRSSDALEQGRAFADFFPAEPLRSMVTAHVTKVLSGVSTAIDLRTDDGRRINLAFLPRFQSGARQRGFFLLVEDRTDVELVKREGEALRERMTAILRNAADVIIVADAAGVIEEANDAVFDLLGWRPEELVGLDLNSLMDEPYRSAHRGHLERYAGTGRSGILNVGPRPLPARRRDGGVVAIELSVGEAWVAGERKFIGVCRGIGDRLAQKQALEDSNRTLQHKLAELERLSADLEASRERASDLARTAETARRKAEDASRAKSRSLATLSHELRTPMNGVLAVADLLATRPLAKDDLELIEIIRRSGRDLLSLLNEILDLSRIEAGAMTINAEPFSLSELVEGVGAVWTLAAYAKGLELEIDTAGLPGRLVGDAGRIKQILSNLLNNAIKFTPSGHVALKVRGAPAGPGFAALRFTVTDTGLGIDPTVREHLFEPFVIGVSEQARRQAGTGLGLAISRELVGLMNGTIRAEEAAEGGTRIVLELELPVVEAPVAVVAPTEGEQAGLAEGARVLVAEDHPVNRRVIGLLLDQIGVAYETVEDGEAAVAAAAKGGFDAILMDVRMPRMDGIEATRAIRSSGSVVPIVAVTADATAEEEVAMRAVGMNAVLPKPISLLGLAHALETALAVPATPDPEFCD